MLPTINHNNNKMLYKRQAKALYQYDDRLKKIMTTYDSNHSRNVVTL